MHSFSREAYGVKLTFSGSIPKEEMAKWVEESKVFLSTISGPFCVFVDMRALKALDPEARAEMEKGQRLYKEKGMARSFVVVDSSITRIQLRRIAKETGIDTWERYLDDSCPRWEERGRRWLVDRLEPGD